MHAEGIERVIVAELRLEHWAGPVGNRSGEHADKHGGTAGDEASGVGHGGEARDRARAEPEHGDLSAMHFLDGRPGEGGGGRAERRGQESLDGDTVGSQGGTRVEAISSKSRSWIDFANLLSAQPFLTPIEGRTNQFLSGGVSAKIFHFWRLVLI